MFFFIETLLETFLDEVKRCFYL